MASFRIGAGALLIALLAVSVGGPGTVAAQKSRPAPKFYADDPLMKVADTQDASQVQPREISLTYDASINLFGRPGLGQVGRAESINTIDEVPDSSWYTNRTKLTLDAIRQGV